MTFKDLETQIKGLSSTNRVFVYFQALEYRGKQVLSRMHEPRHYAHCHFFSPILLAPNVTNFFRDQTQTCSTENRQLQ